MENFRYPKLHKMESFRHIELHKMENFRHPKLHKMESFPSFSCDITTNHLQVISTDICSLCQKTLNLLLLKQQFSQ